MNKNMNYTIKKKLPPIEDIIHAYPLSELTQQKISSDREEIKKILAGLDDRLLIVVGPCSAWPKQAVLEYAEKLLAINDKVKHALKLVMRVYIQKPRTRNGWTGPFNHPDPSAAPNIEVGRKYARELMIKITNMGVAIADEALFTNNAKGYLELLAWVAIGARSAENQGHRFFAATLDCAVGMKNPTHGSLAVGVNSVVAAQHAQIGLLDGNEVQAHGNPYAHLVLRGGNHSSNYSIAHLREVKQYMDFYQIKNPAVIIDASHDNCLVNGIKEYRLQTKIIYEVIENLKSHPDLKNLVKGFMLESFIKEGNQKIIRENPIAMDHTGLSITDPCIGWEETEKLLLNLAKSYKIG